MNKFFKLDIQMFADPGASDESMKELLAKVTDSGNADNPKESDPKKADPKENDPEDHQEDDPQEGDKADPQEGDSQKGDSKKPEEEDSKNPEEDSQKDDPEDSTDSKGISELRKKQREDAKKVKELEKEKNEIAKKAEENKKRLIKAIRLGIKGDTEEEILNNLTAYEIKEEAETKGLTEEQITAQKELEEKMKELNDREKKFLFNNRIFNLQKELDLTEEEIMEFITVSGETGIDLLTSGVNFKNIYERIMKKPESSKEQELLKKISELEAEIAILKNNSAAPGKSIPGSSGSSGDWFDELRAMKPKGDK